MTSIDDILEHLSPGEIVSAIILSRKGYKFTEESLAYGFSKATEKYPRLACIDGDSLYRILYEFQNGGVVIPADDCKILCMPDAMRKSAADVLLQKSKREYILEEIAPVANTVWAYEAEYANIKKQ
jgi:hypothetical protein